MTLNSEQRGSEMTANVAHQSFDTLDTYAKYEAIKHGVSLAQVESLIQETQLTQIEVIELIGMTKSTWHRNSKAKGSDFHLSELQSELVLRLENIHAEVAEYFGDIKGANQWLRTKRSAFGDHSPLELMTNSTGMDIVEDTITKMYHGFSA